MSAEEKRKQRLKELVNRTKNILDAINAKEILDEDEYDDILKAVEDKHDVFEKNVSNTIKTTFADEISKARQIIAKQKASTGSKAKKKAVVAAKKIRKSSRKYGNRRIFIR